MMERHAALLPALAAVMGAVSLDSAALGPGGAAAAAVPALLSASLAEGSSGLVKAGASGAGAGPASSGRGQGGSAAAAAASAPCCQCLAAVLNKLATGPELDSAVALVVEALTAEFAGLGVGDEAGGGGGDAGAMDVEGAEMREEAREQRRGRGGETVGPVQCLAWAVKAVAMRGGLGEAFSALLDLLCGLLYVRKGPPFSDAFSTGLFSCFGVGC